uniref:CSON011083 protein n=1 Tax=Culicoides sonorensis TaxID=179676 RepID=A0A336LQG4_CULSO
MESSNKESENKNDDHESCVSTNHDQSESKPTITSRMELDNERPGPSTSSMTQPKVEDDDSLHSSPSIDHTDSLPNTSNVLAPEEGLPVRKKRFSSRNYRNHQNSKENEDDLSSSDEEMRENILSGGNKRQRKHEARNAAPPPPEYLEELQADNEAGDNDEVDDTINSDISSTSSSSSSSSSESDFDNHIDDETSSDDETVDVNFLNIERPKCTWVALRELYYREHGLSGHGRRCLAGRDPQMFKTRVSGSLNCVERLELMAKLERHEGCVNGLNFSSDGHLLASGSDDLKVVLWNWTTGTVARVFKSGHRHNVFQTKFYGNGPDIKLVTTARDGLVRNHVMPSSGGRPYSSKLFQHSGAVHRVAVGQSHPCDVLTAGEDGLVISIDMREPKTKRLVIVKNEKNIKVTLYGVSTNPLYNEFCVYGRDKYVRVYDRRNCKTVMKNYIPESFKNKTKYGVSVTAAVYNNFGNEILASYADDDIYLFNRNNDEGKFEHNYKGHLNSQTIKGVNFFGSGSEFIVSGSDCGNIFFWDKKTTKIVQWMRGDENGAVNVLEPHPAFPFLATSGIDSDVKIWVPSNEKPPDLSGLEKCVRRNLKLCTKTLAYEDSFDEDFLRLILQRHHTFRSVARDFPLNMPDHSISEDEVVETPLEDLQNDTSDDDGSENRRFPCSPI